MKKFLAAAVLALLIAGASNQQASAWCKFNFGCGFNIGFEKGGDSTTTFSYSKVKQDGCPGGHCATPVAGPAYYGMGLPVAAPAHVYAAPAHQAAPATPAQPTFPPAPKPADSTSGYQPASYWNYSQTGYAAPTTGYQMYPNNGYGYGNAPSYWYGR
jgi:hypothetical protein